jgi:cytidine deaminase
MCAERTAIFATGANYPDQHILAIAVAACKANDQIFLPVTPCGACRQAILEYESKQNKPIRLILQSSDSAIFVIPSICTLLPLQFTRSNLL